MIGFRFMVMTALVVPLGLWARFFRSTRLQPFPARWAVYFASGLLALTVEMMFFSVAGIPWSVPLLLIAPLILGAATLRYRDPAPRPGGPILPLALALASILVFAAIVLSGAATSFDLLLFWGVKGQQFGISRLFDEAFLRDPNHRLMHPDYPPLLPLYYAWTMLGGDRLDWWGASASAVLFLFAASAAIYGLAAKANEATNNWITPLFASMFVLLFTENAVGGNAEPALLFFETVALAAIAGGSVAAASIAITGAVLTKVEGTPFALLCFTAFVLSDKGSCLARLRKAASISALPAVAALAWIAYSAQHSLLSAYSVGSNVPSLPNIRIVSQRLAQDASFGVLYLPWIAVVLLILCGKPSNAIAYAVAALAYALFLVIVYGRDANTVWISWSATRVMMTPVLFLFFGAVAALNGRA